MLESFNETETYSFSFHPSGYIETGVCGHSSDNGALHWDDTSGLKYTTSQQLIVQENFMLQFKVFLTMVSLHWQGQRQRPIKNGLYRVVWRCSYCSETETDENLFLVLCTILLVSVLVLVSV